MSTTSISSTDSRPSSRGYDTGFPESFATHTTSMRHPDAKLAPDAYISAEDIDPAKTMQRSRHSLLHKHRRTISHGTIPADHYHAALSPTIESPIDSAIDVEEPKTDDSESLRPSAKDRDSIDQSVHEAGSPSIPPQMSPTQPGHRRKTSNPFKRWR
jgi:hypothetical protein